MIRRKGLKRFAAILMVAIEEGSYHVMQIYNLHGNGAYSYTPSFNGPY